MNTYAEFLQRKSQIGGDSGFAANYLPEALFPFQRALVEWATRKGRAAIFADCFVPGTLVKSGASYKPIESLSVGDPIETLDGSATVERHMSRPYSGEVVEVRTASGFFPLKVTPNHKFYVLRRKRCIIPSRGNTLCSTGCDKRCPAAEKPHCGYAIELVTADALTTDDCLLFRQPRERSGQFTSSPAYLRMAGYWLAEGWLSRQGGKLYGIHFGFNTDEEHTLAADVIKDLAELGARGRIERSKEKHNVVVVSASSNRLAERLKLDFGEHSGGKRLPHWFGGLSRADQLALLSALFKGDAHINEQPPTPEVGGGRLSQSIRFVTVSYELASGVRDALLGMGIRCSAMREAAKIDGKGVSHREAYRILIARRFMGEFGFPQTVIRRDLRQTEHQERGQTYSLIPIRALSRSRFDGEVYNLTSSGHDSYLTDAGTSKNCGLGKSLCQLVWAENVVRHTNGRVLVLAPLAVGPQTVREADKFGIGPVCLYDAPAAPRCRVYVANYERLHHLDPNDYAGVVCDESSILKNFDGRRRKEVTEFMRTVPYRLLCTATAAPNDYPELGTSSEALGDLGNQDMLARFFKHDDDTIFLRGTKHGDFSSNKWRFKAHAERGFWRWVCSWARAVRRPSDMGFSDDGFALPPLDCCEHEVAARTARPGVLFDVPATTLAEQREEQKRTVRERCEKVAELVNGTGEPAVCWVHLNEEGDALTDLIPDAVEIQGSDSDKRKEEVFTAFAAGQVRVLVTKPKIGGFGLNWQHCAHQTYFPSHSFEQWYQGVRRCWRFGQKRAVRVDVVTTDGSAGVLANLRRKADAADRMFAELVKNMNDALSIGAGRYGEQSVEAPKWLQSTK